MSYVYIFPLGDGSAFKIGKANNPKERLATLSRWHSINKDECYMYHVEDAYAVEYSLHTILESFRLAPILGDGGTEFFAINCIEEAKGLLKLQGAKQEKLFVEAKFILWNDIQREEAILGHLLKARRIELDITQAELAEQMGVSRRTIRKLEDGLGRISNLILMLSTLGLAKITTGLPKTTSERMRAS